MVEFFVFLLTGLLLGAGFVEISYRLTWKGISPFYFLTLPAKLLLWAVALYFSFLLGGILGFTACLTGFLLSFFVTLLWRGFIKHGRPEGA